MNDAGEGQSDDTFAHRMMNEYEQFLRAAELKDRDEIVRLIQQHPELHSYEGEHEGLLGVIEYLCPEFFEAAFLAGLSPDSGPSCLLQGAATRSDLDLVRLCLRHGADIERRNDEGETALGYAVSWGSLETVQLLVEAGADVNAIEGRDGNFSTALDSACSTNPEFDRPEVRAFLREHGAKKFSEL